MRWLLVILLVMTTTPAIAFDIQGHRGARGLWPENTLPAFAAALGIGVTTLELDAGITRDGVVVVSHDRLLNPKLVRDEAGRFLSRHGPSIHALTWAELQRYDVGRLNPDDASIRQFPRQQPVDGTRIPSLARLFDLVRRAGNEQVRFNIETKLSPLAPGDTPAPGAFVHALLAVVRENGMAGRTTIQSFDWRTLLLVQRDAPEIPTVYLSSQQAMGDTVRAHDPAGSPWTAGMVVHRLGGSVPRAVKAAGGAVWSPHHLDLTPANVAEARALGLKIVPWTVNTVAEIERALDLGIDGLISDYPDLLREIVAGRGWPVPAPTPVEP